MQVCRAVVNGMGFDPACIGFDADDTLWHNERMFRLTQARFAELLAPHVDVPDLDAALAWAEKCPAAKHGKVEIRSSAMGDY